MSNKLSTKHRRDLLEVIAILNAIVSPMPVKPVKQGENQSAEQVERDEAAVFERLSKSKPRGKV